MPRAQLNHQWKMLGGSIMWVREDTKENMNRIYEYLKETNDKRRANVRQTFLKISRGTGINRISVRNACMIMAFCQKPVCRIRCALYRSKKTARVGHIVELLEWEPNVRAGS